LPVRVNQISTGTLKQKAFDAGPDVAGTVDLERGIQLCSHVVKVADRSVDVNCPIRAASGRGGDHYCATTSRNPEVDGLTFSMQSNARDSGGAQNNCMCEKKRVLKQPCSGVYSGVKTVRVGKTDVDENMHVEPVIKKLPASLTPDHREKVIDLIKRNSDLFSKHDFDVGCTDFVTATINTDNHPPISEPLRRHARVHLDVIDETIDKMIQADIVELYILEWAANLVVVPKKDDQGRPATPRITIDFRKLNTVTYKDKYPIPNTKDCLQSLNNVQWLSSIDMSNSFYQVNSGRGL